MKQLTKRITAIALCAALGLGITGVAAAQETGAEGGNAAPQVQLPAADTDAAAQPAAGKDESVYVFAAADGSTKSVIVSDWLQNSGESSTLLDVSALTALENIKGDETCTRGADDAIVWDAQGNDIYYQGSCELPLPVEMKIDYTLDGAAISPDALAGKSGRVSIRFTYAAKQYDTVTVAGKQERIYVPFALLTGAVLDTERFHNITVTNGKLLNDGERTFVVGLAFAGLQESLGLSREALELPAYVEITADVTDFALDTTLTLATNQIFSALDSAADEADSLGVLAVELSDAARQLTGGSDALYDGLCELAEQTALLAEGVQTLASGADALYAGARTAQSGAAELAGGAAELNAGLDSLSANSAALNAGAAQVFDALLANADAQLKSEGLNLPALTQESYAATLDGVITSLSQAGKTQSAQSIGALKASLDSYQAFYQGLAAYTAGVDSAASGASALSSGAAALKTGTAQLSTGAATLSSGAETLGAAMPALTDGTAALREGAGTLADGLNTLYTEVFSKLAELLDGDPEELAARAQATAEVCRSYQNYAGIGAETDGQVKFLFRTDEIKTN